MLKSTALALGTLLLSTSAFAASQCNDAQDQATMTQCANAQLMSADKELNLQFKEIEHRLADNPETKKQFIAAQRAWIAFRDAECRFSTSTADGGSIYPMLLASCKAELTTDRNTQLKGYLNCPEGDVSCPVPAAE